MATSQEPFTLYHNFWSSRALMVRLALKLGKQPPNAREFPLILKDIDIKHGGQLEKSFLCDINPMGTVPVLTHPTLLQTPLADTMQMTRLLYGFYPQLSPKEHELEIEKRLQELHAINFATLSFRDNHKGVSGTIDAMKTKLEDPSLSSRYREALENKHSRQAPKLRELFTTETIENEKGKTIAFLSGLADLKKKFGNSGSPWIFGTEYGTALDAHLLIWLQRLKDIGLESLVNPDMLAYGEAVMEGTLWKDFMQGRVTMP